MNKWVLLTRQAIDCPRSVGLPLFIYFQLPHSYTSGLATPSLIENNIVWALRSKAPKLAVNHDSMEGWTTMLRDQESYRCLCNRVWNRLYGKPEHRASFSGWLIHFAESISQFVNCIRQDSSHCFAKCKMAKFKYHMSKYQMLKSKHQMPKCKCTIY